MKKCNYPGCDKNMVAKGFCDTHYHRLLRNNTLETKTITKTVFCRNCGAFSNIWRKGLCQKCYKKQTRHTIKSNDIFKNKPVWKSYNSQELDNYINKIFKYYRLNGFPYPKYSIEEKTVQLEKLRNYDCLALLENNIIKWTPHGIGVLSSYFPNMYDISCNNKLSPIEYFNDDFLFKEVIKRRLKTGTYINDGGIRKAFRALNGVQSVSNFRPSAAKCIYDNFSPINSIVYDMSAGFGGRLFGALASHKVNTYIGTEPSSKTFDGLLNIKNDFEKKFEKNIELYKIGSEDYIPNKPIDLCFTSPPYFDTEKYSDEDSQSYKKFPNINQWLNIFVRNTIKNCYSVLKEHGKLIINIASTSKYKNLNRDYLSICFEEGFVLENELKYLISRIPTKTNRLNFKFEPIYILKKAKTAT